MEEIQKLTEEIEDMRNYAEKGLLKIRWQQNMIAKLRSFNYSDFIDDEFILLEIDKLFHSSVQTIFSSKKQGPYTSTISEHILNWETILKKYLALKRSIKSVDNFSKIDNNFSLLTESEGYFVLLFLFIERGTTFKQDIMLSEILKYGNGLFKIHGTSPFQVNSEEYKIMRILVLMKKIKQNYNFGYTFIFKDFSIYLEQINHEYKSESNLIKKEGLKEILEDFQKLQEHVFKIKKTITNKDYDKYGTVDMSSFDSSYGYKAINYMKKDTQLMFNPIYDNGIKTELDNSFKFIYENIDELKKVFESGGIIEEINKANTINTGDFGGKIPFSFLESEGVNNVRVLKFLEISGEIKIESWSGKEDYWESKSMKTNITKTEENNGSLEFQKPYLHYGKNKSKQLKGNQLLFCESFFSGKNREWGDIEVDIYGEGGVPPNTGLSNIIKKMNVKIKELGAEKYLTYSDSNYVHLEDEPKRT